MRVSAKADYAVRAAVELAVVPNGTLIKAQQIATSQDIPVNYLENILAELRHAGIVRSRRGAEGGFGLARAADEVTVADIIRAVEGPLATVRGGTAGEFRLHGGLVRAPSSLDRGAQESPQCRRARDARRHRER